jgi:hypothetical protein
MKPHPLILTLILLSSLSYAIDIGSTTFTTDNGMNVNFVDSVSVENYVVNTVLNTMFFNMSIATKLYEITNNNGYLFLNTKIINLSKSSSESFIANYSSPYTISQSNDALLNNVSVYNSSWLEFDGLNDYVRIKKGLLTQPLNYLMTPTYDGTNESVHPSVLYFEDGWNGWKYWMAMTPYNNTKNYLENPSILVSNDSKNWQVPAGLTNPIYMNRSNIGLHNADTELLYNPSNNQIYLYWIETQVGLTYVWFANATNSTNWNQSIKNIFNYSSTIVSPSAFIKDGTFYLYFVNVTSGCSSTNANPVYFTSVDGYTINNNSVHSTNFKNPSSLPFSIWHNDVQYISSLNSYWMVYSASPLGTCGTGDMIFFSNSSDGINWNTFERPIINMDDTSIYNFSLYRPTLLYKSYDDLQLFYSGRDGFGVPARWHISLINFSMSFIEQKLNTSTIGKTEGTYCLWFNTPVAKTSALIGERTYISSSFYWRQLNLRNDNKFSWGCQNGSTQLEILAGTSYNVNVWNHVCALYNSSNMSVYLNGALSESAGKNCSGFDSLYDTKIGTYYDYVSSRAFAGNITDIRIYDRVLTSTEILSLYNQGKKNNISLISNSLKDYYKFSEFSGTTLYDTSGNNNHGTISGATWRNDSIKIPLVRNYDYSLNSNQFLLLNGFYDKTYVMLDYTDFSNRNFSLPCMLIYNSSGSLTLYPDDVICSNLDNRLTTNSRMIHNNFSYSLNVSFLNLTQGMNYAQVWNGTGLISENNNTFNTIVNSNGVVCVYQRLTDSEPKISSLNTALNGCPEISLSGSTLTVVVEGSGDVGVTNLGLSNKDVYKNGAFVESTFNNDYTFTAGTYTVSSHVEKITTLPSGGSERALYFVFLLVLFLAGAFLAMTRPEAKLIVIIVLGMAIALLIIRSII